MRLVNKSRTTSQWRTGLQEYSKSDSPTSPNTTGNISDFQDLIPPSRKLGTERAPKLKRKRNVRWGQKKKQHGARKGTHAFKHTKSLERASQAPYKSTEKESRLLETRDCALFFSCTCGAKLRAQFWMSLYMCPHTAIYIDHSGDTEYWVTHLSAPSSGKQSVLPLGYRVKAKCNHEMWLWNWNMNMNVNMKNERHLLSFTRPYFKTAGGMHRSLSFWFTSNSLSLVHSLSTSVSLVATTVSTTCLRLLVAEGLIR
jgi:hypothetical protein